MTRRWFLALLAPLLLPAKVSAHPTFADLSTREGRWNARSTCHAARIHVVLSQEHTKVGRQVVYACNLCDRLYVVREQELV